MDDIFNLNISTEIISCTPQVSPLKARGPFANVVLTGQREIKLFP